MKSQLVQEFFPNFCLQVTKTTNADFNEPKDR